MFLGNIMVVQQLLVNPVMCVLCSYVPLTFGRDLHCEIEIVTPRSQNIEMGMVDVGYDLQ